MSCPKKVRVFVPSKEADTKEPLSNENGSNVTVSSKTSI
jgi:hypothetical protein